MEALAWICAYLNCMQCADDSKTMQAGNRALLDQTRNHVTMSCLGERVRE